MWQKNSQMWFGIVQYEDETVKCEEKKKGTTKCDKSTITCDVGTTQCEYGTVKCEKKKIKEPPNVTKYCYKWGWNCIM